MLAAVKQSDVSGRDELARLEEDIRQQDLILAGYEKDNEQLRIEMKQLRATNKSNEERMFHENHKLKMEVANLRSVILSPHFWITISSVLTEVVYVLSHHKMFKFGAEILTFYI